MKTISRDDYLRALGLFYLGNEHQRKAEEFEKAMCTILGTEAGCSHTSDAIYNNDLDNFDEALKRDGIIIKETAPENADSNGGS
jgi:hypothetical protein